MANKITDLFLYRYRFALGYILISLAGLGLLGVALLLVPGGIDKAEMHAVIQTSALSLHSLDPSRLIDAPYHLLQWLSIHTLGVNELSIKLPSAIIAILTVIGAIELLGHWFRRNVAILTTIVVLTNGEFLFLAQNGTPDIMPIFWAVWILYSALMVSRQAHFSTLWKIILFATAALSLYTPLSIYMLVAVVSAGLLHPHLRYLIRRITLSRALLATIFAIGIITPLGYAIAVDHTVLFTLIGWPDNHINLLSNLSMLSSQYINFASDSSGVNLTPIYGVGSIMLIILGIVRFATTKYTARNYILTAWIILLIPIILLNPLNIGITFIPIMLLIAKGIDLLFRRWYSLFPRNPYARLAGLVPLAILMGGMITSGVVRYIDSYTYNPIKVQQFSHDLGIVNRQLSRMPSSQQLTLVSTKSAAPFYDVVAKYNSHITVVTTVPNSLPSGPLLVARGVQYPPSTIDLSRIMTDNMSLYSDRFYLYQK